MISQFGHARTQRRCTPGHSRTRAIKSVMSKETAQPFLLLAGGLLCCTALIPRRLVTFNVCVASHGLVAREQLDAI